MEHQEPKVQAAALPQEIEPAPPAYTPQLAPKPEPHEALNPAASQGPGPATALPANLSSTPQKALPLSPAVPEQPALGVTPLNRLGDGPQWIDCPFCKRRTMTRLNSEGTAMQVVAGVACCLLCVCLACVPCLAHWFEETNYFCSQCNKKVAKRSDSGVMVVYGPEAVVPSKYA